MSKPTVVLCAPVRTAIGTYNGSLKGVAATELERRRSKRPWRGLPSTARTWIPLWRDRWCRPARG